MGYDTFYTITIFAETEARRRALAEQIYACSLLPYIAKVDLTEGVYEEDSEGHGVLKFQNRSWHRYVALDLGGKWYDPNLSSSLGYGGLRGINLMKWEIVKVHAEGDDYDDIWRLVATSDIVFRQYAKVAFVNQQYPCPDDDDERDVKCSGCQACSDLSVCFPEMKFESISANEY